MQESTVVIVAHRRLPVQRMLRTILETEGLTVRTASTAAEAVLRIQSDAAQALVLDADLVREETLDGAALTAQIERLRLPLLVVSWEPGDRLLARRLHDAPFISRPDDVDRIVDGVRGLLARRMPV